MALLVENLSALERLERHWYLQRSSFLPYSVHDGTARGHAIEESTFGFLGGGFGLGSNPFEQWTAVHLSFARQLCQTT